MPARRILWMLFFSAVFTACSKPQQPVVTCQSKLFAYHGFIFNSALSPRVCIVGIVNQQVLLTENIAAFAGGVALNQGTYHTGHNCYYVFDNNDSRSTNELYRVDITGTTTRLRYAGYPPVCMGVIYSKLHNKLYCIQVKGGAGYFGELLELIVTDSTYTVVRLANTLGSPGGPMQTTTTIDQATGTLYYLANTGGSWYNVERYVPGDAQPVQVAAGSNALLVGLRYNRNDSMLYALRKPKDTAKKHLEFVRINPRTKQTEVVSQVTSPAINTSYFSACIDQCNNEYVFSTAIDSLTGIIGRISRSGLVTRHDTTYSIYQGVDIPE